MAESMIGAQTAEIAQMKEWRGAWFGSDTVPPMGGMMHDMAALETAEPFDLAFLDAMIPHHQDAVTMSKDSHEQSQVPEIKELTAKIIKDQKEEIRQLREWRRAWYPGAPERPEM